MKYVIVYWSRYGNNKKLVDALAEKLKQKGETQIFKTDEADPAAMPSADVYVFSTPTEAHNIQRNMRSFMKKLQSMDGKKYGIINTHGMKKNWLPKMEKLLSKKNMVKVTGVDFQVLNKDEKTGNPLIDNWEDRLDEFAQKL
ncbi:MAG: flavodoxin domain-containing protein [Candidatus Thermoplasmatota archaeon]|nr:flavodoxin domain-containing protein [Candidatus Thermoplasmatota archaeon]MBU1940898.1 flavodoxin domain-containing protein [Candidatus Thermoplasmatota archaeon]